jgi:hypothetical protein
VIRSVGHGIFAKIQTGKLFIRRPLARSLKTANFETL